MDKAMVILREKGLASQTNKAGRTAAEGVVVALVQGSTGVIAEINCETDFVAKNPEFTGFANAAAQTVIDANPADLETLNKTKISGGSGETVEEALQNIFLKIRENMKVRRFERAEGTLVSYVHGEGKIGVLVQLKTDADGSNPELLECGKNCALQIAALNPGYLNRESVPESVILSEKEIIKKQMAEDPKMQGKPDQVLDKIAEGKLGKYFSENCLLEQEYVKDGDLTVQKYVDGVAKAIGAEITVKNFIRYERGEGIERQESNLADEVAQMIGK
jgi:elongation factor Ts